MFLYLSKLINTLFDLHYCFSLFRSDWRLSISNEVLTTTNIFKSSGNRRNLANLEHVLKSSRYIKNKKRPKVTALWNGEEKEALTLTFYKILSMYDMNWAICSKYQMLSPQNTEIHLIKWEQTNSEKLKSNLNTIFNILRRYILICIGC